MIRAEWLFHRSYETMRKTKKSVMSIIFILHIVMGSILTLGVGIWITLRHLEAPDEHPMEEGEQWWRSIRNLLINISFFSAAGWTIGLALNTVIVAVGGNKIVDNHYISVVWIILSIIIWRLQPKKLYFEPPTNNVLRTVNPFNTEKRQVTDDRGLRVDNAVKYYGPRFVILHIFERIAGVIETESQENLHVKIAELSFSNDTGSGEFVLSYAIEDVDAYAGNGPTEAIRKSKVEETIGARVKAIMESITTSRTVADVQLNAQTLLGSLSDDFRNRNDTLETRLGIRIQYLEISEINQSAALAAGTSAGGVHNIIMTKAQEMVTASGGIMPLDEAYKLVAAQYGKIKVLVISTASNLPENVRVLVGSDGEATQSI